MNKLQLCQRLCREAALASQMSTTVSQSGQFLLMVDWIDTAWNDIQLIHDDWDWMRSSYVLGQGAVFATVAGQASYPLGSGAGTCGVTVATFGKWDPITFRTYTTTVGTSDETYLDNIPYDTWRDAYMIGALRSVQTRPVAVAIGPNKSVCVGPPSNGLYTVEGDYWLAPSAMSGDASEPTGLPAQFQMLIVWRALTMYGSYQSAPEAYERGRANYNMLMAPLEAQRLPVAAYAGALA